MRFSQHIALPVFLLFFVGFSYGQVQTGKASYYAKKFEGRKTASGAVYKNEKATASHRHLPFGTKIRVTNLANNLSTIVTINDRGPFVPGRIIDVSRSAAKKLGFLGDGVTDVAIELLDTQKTSARELAQTEQKETKDAPKKAISTRKTAPSAPTSSSEEKETAFYALSVNRVQPDWFGVQIGSFQEAANLISLADHLKASYDEAVTVQLKTVQGVHVYTLVIGKFKNHQRAEKFSKKIDVQYPGSFVVNFADLNTRNK